MKAMQAAALLLQLMISLAGDPHEPHIPHDERRRIIAAR